MACELYAAGESVREVWRKVTLFLSVCLFILMLGENYFSNGTLAHYEGVYNNNTFQIMNIKLGRLRCDVV
jgi:hypothetical protein